MEELARVLIQTEILLESDMFRTLLTAYLYMLIMLFFAFLNIYSTDKYEFMHNEQKCWEFKHRMFFIIMKSKEKHIVSKKTFILELIGYLIFILTITVFICSLKQTVTVAIILLAIVTVIILAFACVTDTVYNKIPSRQKYLKEYKQKYKEYKEFKKSERYKKSKK